jgi:hypothetical protein
MCWAGFAANFGNIRSPGHRFAIRVGERVCLQSRFAGRDVTARRGGGGGDHGLRLDPGVALRDEVP